MIAEALKRQLRWLAVSWYVAALTERARRDAEPDPALAALHLGVARTLERCAKQLEEMTKA